MVFRVRNISFSEFLVLLLNLMVLGMVGYFSYGKTDPLSILMSLYVVASFFFILSILYRRKGRSGPEVESFDDSNKSFLQKLNLEALYHAAPAGDVLIDLSGNILDFNQSFQEKFFQSQERKENRSIYDLIIEEDHESLQRTFQNVYQKKTVHSTEIRFEWGDEVIMYIGLFESTKDSTVSEPFYFAQVFDNKEQKSVRLRLIQSQKTQAMGQLAGGIAHDFNNLLTAMIGFCDLLLLRHTPGDQSFTDIMQIKQNANRASNLVRQLLAFSRQQTLQPRVINITESLADLSILLQRLIGSGINLKMYHGKELGLVRVDQGQFEQVITNLVVNARDALSGNGEIFIKTSNKVVKRPITLEHDTIPPGSYVLIEVIDNGCGIMPQYRDRIFDPFFSTKETGSGTGLGLATVQGIVNQTGGHIDVDSETDIGTKFSIYLPRYQGANQETEKPQDKSLERKDLTGSGTLMIVEDEDAVRVFASRALRDKGYKVHEASNGEEGLKLIQDLINEGDIPSLMITDVVMPLKDGPTLAQEGLELLPNLKILFMSGYAEDSFRQRIDENEDMHFISKPFTLKAMAQKVKEILDVKKDPMKIAG